MIMMMKMIVMIIIMIEILDSTKKYANNSTQETIHSRTSQLYQSMNLDKIKSNVI